jgi:hypothetical protein
MLPSIDSLASTYDAANRLNGITIGLNGMSSLVIFVHDFLMIA